MPFVNRALTLIATIVFALFNVGDAVAAQTPPARSQSLGKLLDCRGLTDPTARLACYDSTSSALAAAEQSGDVTVVDRADVRAARRQLFGFDLPQVPSLFERDAREHAVDQIETTLSQAVQLGDQRWVFTLDDGSTWRQVDASPSRFQNRPGSVVRVQRAAMGSYLMTVGRSGGIRVRRQ